VIWFGTKNNEPFVGEIVNLGCRGLEILTKSNEQFNLVVTPTFKTLNGLSIIKVENKAYN